MTAGEATRRSALLVVGLIVFAVIATLNSAGYRYGASDQAFYVPAVVHQLHPELYPRDAPLITSQAKLTLVDEALAFAARLTGASLPVLFAGLYVISLAVLMGASLSIGAVLYRSGWTTIALTAALTLRHAIAETGANTLEGYFHPRQLAFALGAWALAFFLRERPLAAFIPLALAAALHPTTAVWFIVWVSVAEVVTSPRLRRPAFAAGVVAAAAAAWALTLGPLAGRMHAMDSEWLATLQKKSYLFPLSWPLGIWLLNLAYPAVILWIYRRRANAGLAKPREAGLVAGALTLLGVFVASLPFNAARIEMAIQLQVPRIFWMLDFLATIYVVWALAEGARDTPAPARSRLVAAMVCVFAIARGVYSATIEFPTRPMFATGLSNSDWGRTMRWARESSAPSSHWLADPDHALLYGTSLRVSGERDVFVEGAKDPAIGMYSRPVAMRTRDRIAEIGNFHALTPERAKTLATEYDLDYLVTEERLDLPIAFASGALHVYRLR